MKRHLAPLFALLLALPLLLTGCTAKPAHPAAEPLQIVVASDLHYLSDSLTDKGDYFMTLAETGDGKVIQYSTEITRAFLEEVKAQSPDALILSGDLTLNGEKQSHLDLAALLREVRAAGVPVLVIPGNHDIGYPFARSYSDENGAVLTDNVDRQEFWQIYDGLAGDAVRSRDKQSGSYCYALAEDLWVVMLDANTDSRVGSLDERTLAWLEEQLKAAKEAGAAVITVSHQNLLLHNPLFEGYRVRQAAELQKLFAAYDVRLHLSGHMHIQHIAEENGTYEVLQSSLLTTPNQYGVLEIDAARKLTYHTQPVDVAAWAAAQGSSDANLLDFAAYSRAFFGHAATGGLAAGLEDLSLTPAQREAMVAVAQEMNARYFAGTIHEAAEQLAAEEGYLLWQSQPDTGFFAPYLAGMLENAKDETHLELQLR